ncbi:MAG TPA: HdeD family acid-resistance protein [Gemmataceae bacterium]|nr:HdeD family acid-resistance protein [Gemmataceae bacterium]
MESLARLWWLLVLRGVLAIAFGIIAILAPGAALLAIALWFGAYAFVDGIFSIAAAVTGHAPGGRWGSLLVGGLLGLAVGVFTFVNPWLTEVAILYVIAFWAVATGIIEIIAAIRLRRHIEGEWLLALAGVLSIVFGLVLAAMPLAGMLAVAWLVGAYAVVFGTLWVGLGMQLRRFGRNMPVLGRP